MRTTGGWGAGALGVLMGALAVAAHAEDGYARMLGYLADTHIDGQALSGARGAITVNQAAGDLNLQSNAIGIARGELASVQTRVHQQAGTNMHDTPLMASTRLGDGALAGAGGVATINQASGSANLQRNAVRVSLAEQGIREADDEALASTGTLASAGGQAAVNGRPNGIRSVGVEATALRGFEGVLQLNQSAGSGNATGNVLTLSVSGGP